MRELGERVVALLMLILGIEGDGFLDPFGIEKEAGG